ncbi:MAG: 50S ribosome-binding GTPase [Nanoarchaeota archaeon]|nr:50S ribosome-binding GTPase [Nanoarchaeota archaeon]MBU1051013.1 50S ribosome-binding GTPase [Nanoarchaeota archaeon]MBU1989054.1 50S ribosome-binding GTPase [Nanoarchaeota archaeon]
MGHWPTVMRAIKDADVVVFILDARMPELSRNKDLEQKLKNSGKEFLIVFNKIDLVSPTALKKLKDQHKEDFFTSEKTKDVNKLRLALQIKAKKENLRLEIGIVGYPNVGKSAITNALSRAAKTKVSARAGTTVGLQWASSSNFKIIDSPGVIPFEDDELKLGILGAKNPEKLKNPELVATEIIKLVSNSNPKILEDFYKFKIQDKDEYEILIQIGKTKNLLKKGGLVEETRTALMIIRDWQVGKLRI